MAVGEWDERQLCPDGSCTGLIGSDGHCKVCNRVATNWGNERDRGLRAKSVADAPPRADDQLADDEEWDDEEGGDDHEGDNAEAEKLAELDPSTPSLIGAPAEWSKRTLCSDGACIGVIGADGRCSVCGKPAKGKVPASASRASDADAAGAAGDDERVEAADDQADDHDDDDDEDEDDEDGDDADDDHDDDDDDDDDEHDEPEPDAPASDVPAASDAPLTAAGDAELLAAATDLAAALPTEADFDHKLCPDGACVGLIGANGRCKICGKEST